MDGVCHMSQLIDDDCLPPTGRLVGIDYGTVRVGIAISDLSQTIASPLEVYRRRNEKLDREYFSKLVLAEAPVGFVVGLPLHLSGDESPKSKESKSFGQWLREVTKLPVVWFDERFTTAMAREVLNQSHLSGAKRKAALDKLAAQILLSAFLEASPPATRQIAE